MISVVAIVLVLGALIFFHELGHFAVAKSMGIGVRTFALGFGKKVAGFTLGETEYRLCLVPLGGYVQLLGESPGEELSQEDEVRKSFSHRPPWQRMLVVGAGPVFNFLLALVIYAGIFLIVGQQMLAPTIGSVVEGAPAERAGLKPGDRIVSIQGEPIDYWHQLAEHIQGSEGKRLVLRVERDDSIRTIRVTPRMQTAKNIFGEEVKAARIGIQVAGDTIYRDLGPLEAVGAGIQRTWQVVKLTFLGLVKIIQQAVPLKSLGGPILIAQLVGEQAQQGLLDVLSLTALISVNLGILNLLPVPVLDGGHLLFFGLETVLGRPVDPKWREVAMRIGLSLLIALMILVIYNDLFRLFG
ncbi:MAG: RIP metalloprotease RseP [Desulfohalobiaceae bacterium]|nr:RIP metalloprotease RseP [Desulfohalobiaceae bacterium]